MDGFPQALVAEPATRFQQTLKAPISCVGVGLHCGQRVRLTFRPAPVDHGIVFRRADLGIDIPARFDRVFDTRLCTVIEHRGARVGTIEHVMAALAGCGIDNAVVELDGPEPPILDGSAAPFVFLLDCAGVVAQDTPRTVLQICRTVRVSDGEGFAELRPGAIGFDMALSIDFPSTAIGRQALSLRLTPDSFRQELARARTFGMLEDVDQLRAAGLARGGSLDNAVVVHKARILNPGGLRAPDEFVRHKLLDAVGDLALAGIPLRGRFVAQRSGHTLNNRLLHALFADRAAWREMTPAPMAMAAE
jgi:UDP-3-O-[3-hydroxymyristoyl] N-acetylglucosamine deacetylase